MGRRVKKTVYEWQTDDWALIADHVFVYDGWNLIQELDGSGTIEKSYVWGLDLSQSLQGAGGVGGLLASTDGTDTFLYGYDANGNVGQMIDLADGSVQAHYEYDPFGNSIVSAGALADDNPFRFSTKFFDSEIELYYYGYRYYSAELGRWINRDPINEEGGLNLYIFVGNNPINIYDLLGLAYGTHLTKEEAEQLACAIKFFLVDATFANALFLWGDADRSLTLKFLKKFMSNEGGKINLSYNKIKNDPEFRGERDDHGLSFNDHAEKRLVNNQEYSPSMYFTDDDLHTSLGGVKLRYYKKSDGTLKGEIRDEYTFTDETDDPIGFPKAVKFKFLEFEGCLCGWDGGDKVTDVWMGDLERFGLAKKFDVHVDWELGPNGWANSKQK